MNDEAATEKLAKAIAERRGILWNSLSEKIGICDVLRAEAAALLPVVREIVAEELHAVARALSSDPEANWVHARADALA